MTRTVDEVIAAHGYDPRSTPVDTLMGGPVSMHLAVADAMANDEDPDGQFDKEVEEANRGEGGGEEPADYDPDYGR